MEISGRPRNGDKNIKYDTTQIQYSYENMAWFAVSYVNKKTIKYI